MPVTRRRFTVSSRRLPRTAARPRRLRAAFCLLGLLLVLHQAAPAPAQQCVGDCNANRAVSIDEIIRCVGIALGNSPASLCAACDADSNGQVVISELVQSVRAALGMALLESNGRCLRPGPSGLEPCAGGTALRMVRCDAIEDCLATGNGTAVQAGTLRADGTFALSVDICQIGGATLLYTAEVAPETAYRTMDLGPATASNARTGGAAGTAVLTDAEISPASEAAVRLLADADVAMCEGGELLAVVDAVDTANDDTSFAGLAAEAAAALAVDVARADVGVGAALDCGAGAFVESTFDVGLDGWGVVNDARPPQFVPDGGNPSGHVCAVDRSQGTTWYWSAASQFLGDVSDAYEGTLRFDLKQSSTSSQFDDRDVILRGAGLTLTFDTPNPPGTDWTSYAVDLSEEAGWVESASGQPATAEQFRQVLGSLEQLLIRGEYRSGGDTGCLDNAAFTPPGRSASRFDSPPGDFTTVMRSPDGSYSRVIRDGVQHHFDADGLTRRAWIETATARGSHLRPSRTASPDGRSGRT